MQHLRIDNWRNATNSKVTKITYTRKAYRPKSTPSVSFEDEKRVALVYTGEAQTVEQVMNYHYPNEHTIHHSEQITI